MHAVRTRLHVGSVQQLGDRVGGQEVGLLRAHLSLGLLLVPTFQLSRQCKNGCCFRHD